MSFSLLKFARTICSPPLQADDCTRVACDEARDWQMHTVSCIKKAMTKVDLEVVHDIEARHDMP